MDKCKNATRYKGTRRPTCNAGLGCSACWAIYATRLETMLEEADEADYFGTEGWRSSLRGA